MGPNGPVVSVRGLGCRVAAVVALTLVGASAGAPPGCGTVDLTRAVVVTPPGLTGPERKALAVLVEEVDARTSIRWGVAEAWPTDGRPAVAVGPASKLDAFAGPLAGLLSGGMTGQARPEGFRRPHRPCGPRRAGRRQRRPRRPLRRRQALARTSDGTGPRRLAGRLETSLRPRDTRSAGHQLGYRPKTNSYDGWDLPEWNRYIRDLAVFGVNSVELIPPVSDDADDSPHFPRSKLDMLLGMSRICDSYGLDVWLWVGALELSYGDPAVDARAVAEWEEVFRRTPRLDAVFVPRRRPRPHSAERPHAAPGKASRGAPPTPPQGADVDLDPGLRPGLDRGV